MPDAMPSTDPVPAKPQPLLVAAARGACPQCGAPTLFAGPVRFASSCHGCGLDYGQFNVGDGPAAFLTLIVGAVMVALALTLELKVHPPLWLHVVLWTPLTVVAVMACLRVAKGVLLTLEYRNKAREGRLTGQDQEP
ncbi:DUF983 domain-containing protein [Sphingobium sp. Sx8-8]|uniref:DUF983 domain-containing protein n=1 Tax=Sphingobium sp. Sx8-8 TaxID=2933617 RepID=UPI001F577805|nr:DUF983 domain-containing protein [Sphingobium sp. Sx8-8]